MIRLPRYCLLGCATSLGIALAAGGAVAQTKIVVGYTTGASGFHIPIYIATEKGFFKKEGLDAQVLGMGASALRAAGISGKVNFVPTPGSGSQAILQGAPLRYVVGESLISQWAIVTKSDIKTVKDLKGKTMAYGRPGGAEYDEGDIVLSRNFHMNVGKDYKVISIQNEPDRLAALINGNVDAALISLPTAAKAKVLGFNILLKTGTYLPRVGGTVWTTATMVKEHPDTVRKFIRAIVDAEQYLADNKAGSVPVIQKYFAFKNVKEAAAVWDELHDQYGPAIPHKLMVDLFESRYHRMIKSGLWPKDKKMPDPEQFIARDLLSPTLRSMGYYLQRPPKDQGKPS
jgi:NitT/TauT family transport system substrate-binding protein